MSRSRRRPTPFSLCWPILALAATLLAPAAGGLVDPRTAGPASIRFFLTASRVPIEPSTVDGIPAVKRER